MKKSIKANQPQRLNETAILRLKLSEAEATLNAIRNGEVDTLVVAGKKGPRVFTLEGADQPYRVLIESMKGGALTLSDKGIIMYANQYFADLVKFPLQQVLGANFHSLLAPNDVERVLPLVKLLKGQGSKGQFMLQASNGEKIPVLLAFRPLEKQTFNLATLGLVVTDLTESKRNEEMLRALAHKVVDAQEAERGRVAFELHDGITQLLCGMLFQSQALVESLPKENSLAIKAAKRLSQMAAKTADEVERISRNLRPSVLENLGLKAAFAETCTEWGNRTKLSIKLSYDQAFSRLPVDIELALYRILQEALRNIEKHAHATTVTVYLKMSKGSVSIKIKDNGKGFKMHVDPIGKKSKFGLGLLSMRERAAHLGGTLNLKSSPDAGTEIAILFPFDSSFYN